MTVYVRCNAFDVTKGVYIFTGQITCVCARKGITVGQFKGVSKPPKQSNLIAIWSMAIVTWLLTTIVVVYI